MGLFAWIDRLCGGRARPALAVAEVVLDPSLAPEPGQALCLVGDIHGRLDLLQLLLLRHSESFADHRLVFLGDAVDRGPDSAGVLHRLQELAGQGAVVLRGNHEAMFLDFLDDPADAAGVRWLSHGGRECLESYGVTVSPEAMQRTEPEDVAAAAAGAQARLAARDALRAVMGAADEAWLRALPCLWQSGDLVAAHAGMTLVLPPDQQTEDMLLWNNPTRVQGRRPDGLWVAHGHVISDEAYIRDGRIALDTGAYASGVLSYALVGPGRVKIRLGAVKGARRPS